MIALLQLLHRPASSCILYIPRKKEKEKKKQQKKQNTNMNMNLLFLSVAPRVEMFRMGTRVNRDNNELTLFWG